MPAPSTRLPPTERDFNIYNAVHVRGLSTYSQAELHEISQTRVRQIVRRVVEWLGEVIPPQTQVAKEQETHLARQIAADRFQHQYEQMTTFWDMTQDVKYAGIRIRLTTAQARLGVVGGLIGGLAADAIEGLPVPAYQPPTELARQPCMPATDADPPAEPDQLHEGRTQTEPRELSKSQIRAIQRKYPWLFQIFNFDEITPELIADREAVGVPFPPSLIQQLYDQGYLLRPEAPSPSPPQSAICNSQSEICNPQPEIPSPPPPGDCSTSSEESTDTPIVSPESSIENAVAPTICDETSADQIASAPPSISPSQPLLTPENPLPVTELKITPHQPGATVSQVASADSRRPIHDSLPSLSDP